jgi:hypothetical protein
MTITVPVLDSMLPILTIIGVFGLVMVIKWAIGVIF